MIPEVAGLLTSRGPSLSADFFLKWGGYKQIETMSYAELGQRLGDFYEGCFSQLD